MFVGTYSEARVRFRHAAQQLSLPNGRNLAATRLGRYALRRAIEQSALASGASLLGALAPC